MVDLLKTCTHCTMSFNRFIPAYHHHFGRQCRVADYGFTKLIDLLEALPNIVQVVYHHYYFISWVENLVFCNHGYKGQIETNVVFCVQTKN